MSRFSLTYKVDWGYAKFSATKKKSAVLNSRNVFKVIRVEFTENSSPTQQLEKIGFWADVRPVTNDPIRSCFPAIVRPRNILRRFRSRSLKVQWPYVPRNNRVSERRPTPSTEFPIRSRAASLKCLTIVVAAATPHASGAFSMQRLSFSPLATPFRGLILLMM